MMMHAAITERHHRLEPEAEVAPGDGGADAAFLLRGWHQHCRPPAGHTGMKPCNGPRAAGKEATMKTPDDAGATFCAMTMNGR